MHLDSLQYFFFAGQDLCAPLDDELQAWLRRIPNVSGPTCPAVTPVFFADRIADQSFPNGQAIDSFTLSEASEGVPPIVYGLPPTLPAGLTFDAVTRAVSGTPTVVTASIPYTYKAVGAHGSTDNLEFNIEVFSTAHVENESLPEVFTIQGNYPNPFRDATRLVRDLPWPARTNDASDVDVCWLGAQPGVAQCSPVLGTVPVPPCRDVARRDRLNAYGALRANPKVN